MRIVLTSITALGLGMFAMATSGIAGLAGDLEAAGPKRAPAPVIDAQTRPVDCPLKAPERPRI